MADSPASSDLSSAASVDDYDDQASTPANSSRPSVEAFHHDSDHPSAPASKRRKTGPSNLNLTTSSLVNDPTDIEDDVSLSEDGWSSCPGSPQYDEHALRDEATTSCLWRDCNFGDATNNDDLVSHVQSTHCATGGPKKVKYVCEWGECQRKASNHPSGYALKAHMRSHTKEKPYYCALPECDKAFTRSDALAKHMRTVHEPEMPVNAPPLDQALTGKKSLKLKLSNGHSKHPPNTVDSQAPKAPFNYVPEYDSEGEEIDPSPVNDNITYLPAHHPITGQPGFMIHYPSDVKFTSWENGIPADQLMRLLRRQVHWAQEENEKLKRECDGLEQIRRDEFDRKELLFDAYMEYELVRGKRLGLFANAGKGVVDALQHETPATRNYTWSDEIPTWSLKRDELVNSSDGDVEMSGLNALAAATPAASRHGAGIANGGRSGDNNGVGRSGDASPSPPPTGNSGGFEGEGNPYDNWLASRMAQYEERERQRSLQNTPQKPGAMAAPPPAPSSQAQQEAEADAVGALVDMRSG
ncbi:hypothetical protein K431DRAFT_283545 [Polychaeton citri CBS 116435]|uniref:C2H2-type domain-containing protein n=1 Tax=Polychaeton citri CBS 116435 TaxID=1314669 RepID=A0A9P4QDA8_9PEZI|nr:hypothetical protein K431DRAFT_283545 [Polychaeton citri CBS 116435]